MPSLVAMLHTTRIGFVATHKGIYPLSYVDHVALDRFYNLRSAEYNMSNIHRKPSYFLLKIFNLHMEYSQDFFFFFLFFIIHFFFPREMRTLIQGVMSVLELPHKETKINSWSLNISPLSISSRYRRTWTISY